MVSPDAGYNSSSGSLPVNVETADTTSPTHEELHYLSIAAAARLIATRQLSPVELVQAHLDRIEAINPKLFGYITVIGEQALEQARAAEHEIMAGRYRGPLHGIPYSLKDNYYTKGVRTTAASRVLWDWVPTVDATIHTRLTQAGAILLGKNNTWEFGTGTGEVQPDLPFPIARNAWDTTYFTAGSSSGTGVSVAAGMSMLGMGSDTGGSVRAPSAASGLFGLKPTYGRLSRAGILPNSFSFDAAGPLARNVHDAAIAMQAIAGRDSHDPTSADVPVPDYSSDLSRGVKGLRIGYIRRFHERDVAADPQTVAAVEQAIDILKRLGAEIVELNLPYSVQDYRLCVRLVGQAECLSIHEQDFRERHHLMGRALRDKFLGSIALSSTEFIKATRWRHELVIRTNAVIASCDAVVCGGTMQAVPAINDQPAMIAYMLASANCVFNVTGHPSAAICSGFDQRGLPMSLQIAGRYFDEATVLRVAAAYDDATQWTKTHPLLKESPMPMAVPAARPVLNNVAMAPSPDDIAGILRRMGVVGVDDAMIDRAHALCLVTTGMIARLPSSMPRDAESAHILSLPSTTQLL
jgi:aspartyl-tRNA(Asn)/glutamyl-tRNA(Gln) amidotransferase subunit A